MSLSPQGSVGQPAVRDLEIPPGYDATLTTASPTPPLGVPDDLTRARAEHLNVAPVATPARRERFLHFSPPCVGEEEIAAVQEVLRSDWITTGPQARRFEQEFAHFLGAPGALALNSCTAGLHTALVALGVGDGDEVVTTPFTFAATANVIEHVRARPVFADVEPDTLNIDPEAVAAAITSRTRAIIVVHFAGHPAEMDRLEEIAQAHGLPIIEDAAHALPARYRGRLVGASEHAAAFSFYATMNLTTAEGGLLTGSPGFLDRCRTLALHGMSRDAASRYRAGGSWFYEVLAPGFKYNMTDMQAAIGLVQLHRMSAFQARRREIVTAYQAAFRELDAVELPVERAMVDHAWHLYVLRLRLEALTIDRARFIEELTARNIGSSVHFIPVHLHPYYRDTYGYAADAFPVAHGQFLRAVSLPLHPRLTDDDVGDVIAAVRDIVARHRR